MAELRDEPNFPMEAVLSSQLIPHGPDSGLWTNNWETFWSQRLQLINTALQVATGEEHDPVCCLQRTRTSRQGFDSHRSTPPPLALRG